MTGSTLMLTKVAIALPSFFFVCVEKPLKACITHATSRKPTQAQLLAQSSRQTKCEVSGQQDRKADETYYQAKTNHSTLQCKHGANLMNEITLKKSFTIMAY